MIVLDSGKIQTLNNYFDYDNLSSEMISLEDIAHSLSYICRFNGHVATFYSVCQHSVFIYDRMIEEGHEDIAFYGLMHDAHEYVLPDVNRPLKELMRTKYNFDFNVISNELDEVIFKKFGRPIMTPEIHKVIKHYDDRALFTEKTWLQKPGFDWLWEMEPYPKSVFMPYTDNRTNWAGEFIHRANMEILKNGE